MPTDVFVTFHIIWCDKITVTIKMVNSEDLIQAVKKHKAIWDLADEGYHYKNLKEDAWSGVCLDMYSDWKVLPEGEKYVRQMELKKKWNNIRDYYKKLLSEQQSGEQVRSKKRRRYLYSDILEFIRPVYEKKRPETVSHSINSFKDESNISVSSLHIVESDEQQHDPDNETLEEMETVTFIGIPTNKVSVPTSHPIIRTQQRRNIRLTTPRKRKKNPQLTFFERSIIKSLKNKIAPKDEDPDLSFLKSLLPDVKKLTDSQKLDFKLGIMELLKNIKNTSNDQRDDHDHLADDHIKVETIHMTDEDSS